MRGIIDGDLVIYSTLFYYQARYLENNFPCEEYLDLVKMGVCGVVREWAQRADCEKDFIVALTASPTFRNTVDPEYKANRKDQEKPVYYTEARSELEANFPTLCFPGVVEADDVIGILGTEPDECTVMVSYDKDLKQIPGNHFNPRQKGVDYFHAVSREQAREAFYIQWLMGDRTDNIIGCPGVGPKKAERFWGSHIRGSRDPIGAAISIFQQHGRTREQAIKDFHLIKILTHSDWDFDKNRPKEIDYGKTPEEPQCYGTPA